MWVRGLKHEEIEKLERSIDVAPRVGAWIETKVKMLDILEDLYVAPRVGAWIETEERIRLYRSSRSHPRPGNRCGSVFTFLPPDTNN